MAKAYLSANPPYVIVEKGDTLGAIAQTYSSYIAGTGVWGTGGKVEKLVNLNDISNPNIIVVGQKINLSGSDAKKTNSSNIPVIKAFGLQADTDRTIYATWTWSKSNTDNYRVVWQYATGNGIWFDGTDSTTTSKQNTYNAPSNATKVRFKVKPISKKRKVNGKETSYWTASWSSIKTYEFKNNPPVTPSISDSNISIDNTNKLVIEMNNLDSSVNGINASTLQFQIYRNSTKLVHTGKANISSIGYLRYEWQATAGYKYSVRCRAVRGSVYGDWSDLTGDKWSMPPAPSKIIECSAFNETSAYLTWSGVASAVTYTIQYLEIPDDAAEGELAKDKTYFDVYPSLIQTAEATPDVAGGTPPTFKYINSLKIDKKYCFRVRSNGNGDSMTSKWTSVKTLTLGTTPGQATTWSSATSVMVGDELTLYWMHNAEDKSKPTQAKVYFRIDIPDEDPMYYVHTVTYELPETEDEEGTGTVAENESDDDWSLGDLAEKGSEFIQGLFTTSTSTNTSSNDDEDEPVVSRYAIQTTNFGEGATITWAVATKGSGDDFGEKSVVREVQIFDVPTIEFAPVLDDNIGISDDDTVDFICCRLPIAMDVNVHTSMQKPIGYHLTITSSERYRTVDDVGNEKVVNENEAVYSQYFDTQDNPLTLNLSASDLNLENSVLYTMSCTVSLDSGLGIVSQTTFRVFWDEEQFQPNAEISVDKDSLTASIRPFCEAINEETGESYIVENVLLSVYRRDFDGGFTEIIKDVQNTSATFITDPHPALDYARYRIVARDMNTGGVSYYDVPGYPVNEPAVVLQWNESWRSFDTDEETWTEVDIATEQGEPVWFGSILKLPYNVDISDSNDSEVELVKYIGRKNPVSYYGTQVGHTSSWSVEVPKSDRETIRMLRLLQTWMGDVYAREPYGSGYWAHVSVSFNQNHCETTVPVTIEVTRVEGGA